MKYKIKTDSKINLNKLLTKEGGEDFFNLLDQAENFDSISDACLDIVKERKEFYSQKIKLANGQIIQLNKFTEQIKGNKRSSKKTKQDIKDMINYLEEEVLHLIDAYDDYINNLYKDIWDNINKKLSNINFIEYKCYEDFVKGIVQSNALNTFAIAVNDLGRLCATANLLKEKIEYRIDIVIKRTVKDKNLVSFKLVAKQHLNSINDLMTKCTIPTVCSYCDVLIDEILLYLEKYLVKHLQSKSKEEIMEFLSISEEEAISLIEDIKEIDDDIEIMEYKEVIKSRNILNYKDLNRLAKEEGFEKVRQKGDHGIFKRIDGSLVVIPQGRSIGKGLNLKIQKDIKQVADC